MVFCSDPFFVHLPTAGLGSPKLFDDRFLALFKFHRLAIGVGSAVFSFFTDSLKPLLNFFPSSYLTVSPFQVVDTFLPLISPEDFFSDQEADSPDPARLKRFDLYPP